MPGEELLLVGGAAAAVVAVEATGPTKPPRQGPAGGVIISGTPPGTSVKVPRWRAYIIGGVRAIHSVGTASPLIWPNKQITPSGYYSTGPGAASGDGTLGGKLDLIDQFAEAAYDLLPDDVKQKGADAINGKLGTSLSSSTSWTDLINAIASVTK